MSTDSSIVMDQRMMQRLRNKDQRQGREVSVVTSPGAKVTSWPIKIKSLSSYNVYNVKVVTLGTPGTIPVEIGEQLQAVNLAESFIQTGQLSAGVYAVMLSVGEKNIFRVEV